MKTKLEELKAALGAATKGPWLARKGDTLNPNREYGVVRVLTPEEHGCDPEEGERTEVIVEVCPNDSDGGEADATFIALAHTLMPALLEAVEQRDKLIATIENTVGWNAVDLFPEDFK